ncbi:MAG TPA: ABC transporter substrate-binding protein, partial [Fimbriimonas sp.]
MKWAAASTFLASLALLTGCSQGGFSKRAQEANASEGVFRYPLIPNPTTLDPHRVQDGDTIDLIQQVFEGLTTWGTDNSVQPSLAESWDVSPDGKTYTFHLKKGVKFHNGKEMTADDVKWSIERACDPALRSEVIGNYLDDVVGAMEMHEGKADSVEGVVVVDPHTVKISI